MSKIINPAKMIFVFGSNEAGIHGKGAAKYAITRGAKYGKSYGHYGNSFAIPTKDQILETLPHERINQYVQGFLAYAAGHPKLDFQVTAIGCGLAALSDKIMAPMFFGASKNCYFDEVWAYQLMPHQEFWGTF